MAGEVDYSAVTRAAKAMAALASGSIIQRPVKRYFTRAGEIVLNSAREHSPVDSARLKGSLARGKAGGVWEQSGSRWNAQLRVGTNITHGGFSYPQMLDESSRHTYAYGRRGGGPRFGQPTAGWFSGAPKRTDAKLQRALSRLGEDILKETAKLI